MNVTEKTIEALYALITECFKQNRFLDRFVSVLGVEFACNQAAEKIHKEGFAHVMPVLADNIGERTLERYNIAVKYGATPAGEQEYTSVTEMMQILEDDMIAFQNIYMGVMKIAWNNNDLQVYTDLGDLLEGVNRMVEQAILLNDKIKYYGEDRIMSFDHDIDKFWILGGDE